jgi:hypothetical protein
VKRQNTLTSHAYEGKIISEKRNQDIGRKGVRNVWGGRTGVHHERAYKREAVATCP